jgi:coenzyme F420 hydrogenase subunit beta
METKANVDKIIKNALCTGCGACKIMCPANSIKMIFNNAGYLLANIDESKCVRCGLCCEVCPSNINNKIIFEGEDIFCGESKGCFIGYATDTNIRQVSQSGGIVTALLCYLLDKKIIDAAIVNNFDEELCRPRPKAAITRDEIIQSAGSYYSQSSVVEVIIENSDKKIAAVALGCHTESLNLIARKYPNFQLPSYTIGLICAGQNSGYMIDDLLNQMGCNKKSEKLYGFRFRDKKYGGWPGNVSAISNRGTYSINKNKRHDLKEIYELHRCIACYDQMNIFSDIVCGDPWGRTGKDVIEGSTVVIARNLKGLRLLKDAESAGFIKLECLKVEDVIKDQTVEGRHKNKFYAAKDIFKEKGWLFPYSIDYFESFKHNKVSNKNVRSIRKRLEYSRKYYIAESSEDAYNIAKQKKRKKKIKKIFNRLFYINRIIYKVIKKVLKQ